MRREACRLYCVSLEVEWLCSEVRSGYGTCSQPLVSSRLHAVSHSFQWDSFRFISLHRCLQPNSDGLQPRFLEVLNVACALLVFAFGFASIQRYNLPL